MIGIKALIVIFQLDGDGPWPKYKLCYFFCGSYSGAFKWAKAHIAFGRYGFWALRCLRPRAPTATEDSTHCTCLAEQEIVIYLCHVDGHSSGWRLAACVDTRDDEVGGVAAASSDGRRGCI
ncbi:hypothetical protein CRG98_026065 [Punica granatum]|uniref:Uncharacterized protein n=1 Tax=Punica granatum TaxID=22663 RepID=A0A2I0JC68_PUNGR|nr:hypothetical protein CRG98_026065 [Punica granatum]